ncbi:hypothetical protein JOC86_004564 [Bacillus pakistanensis]|uniref:DUF3574 domain-containing protein n=1 Tax=Rossellomorea pakistanensis TaxID=992288 RepID=A0ABS2NJQ4_9BACI|nr:DUF3574 domain-containing protein [Bacillus pakistanensis]MBM7587989.1 hypothetical protein [Bacillus pakistanensis]
MKTKKIFYWMIPILIIVFLGSPFYAADQKEASEVKQTSPLKGQFYLEETVKIYVPSTYDMDEPIDNTPYVNETLAKFSEMFGGATAIDGTGSWLSDDNELVKEKVTIVYSFAEDLNKKNLKEVVNYARYLKKEMKQSSVSIEVNGKMFFIE